MINLYQGDCLELMKDIPDESVHMILCDLPYGMTANSWDVIIPFDKLWKQYKRIIKRNGCIALFGKEPFSSELRLSNKNMYRYDWVINKSIKTGFLNAKKMPLRKYELVSIFIRIYPFIILNIHMINLTFARKVQGVQIIKNQIRTLLQFQMENGILLMF